MENQWSQGVVQGWESAKIIHIYNIGVGAMNLCKTLSPMHIFHQGRDLNVIIQSINVHNYNLVHGAKNVFDVWVYEFYINDVTNFAS
jgi:hypothetical protein